VGGVVDGESGVLSARRCDPRRTGVKIASRRPARLSIRTTLAG
jgi:hypothetical protein